MKNVLVMITCVLICFLSACSNVKNVPSIVTIEKGFREIPDSIRVGCYWYWISDNISKEGVVKDLYAMKKAGITRVYIGNIDIGGNAYGDVKIFTPEWWEVVHVALKTATELDMEIGMFNSPGWSQSGGPWVKPEQSMRYLAATDTMVKGSQTLSYTIPEYSDSMQLVRVIAYPTQSDVFKKEWKLQQKGYEPVVFEMHLDEPQPIRSFTFTTNNYVWTKAELQAKVDDTYKTIRKFEIDRTNGMRSVGFFTNAPVVISLPATQSADFRLLLDKPINSYGDIEAIVSLSSAKVVERYPEQSLAKMYQRPDPKWNSYMWPNQDWYNDSEGFVILEDKVTDLTAFLSSDGMLTWNVPEGDWIISCFYSYLAWTGDYSILSENVGYSELIDGKTFCRNDIQDSVLQHLLKITEYLINNLDTEDKTYCLKILFGDWNDSINGLGHTIAPGKNFGTGVSVMASLHLYQNLFEMSNILKKIGGYDKTVQRYLKIRRDLKNGILKNAVVTNESGEQKIVHGWGDHGSYKIGSFCDSDGVSRTSFAPYAFWATSDFIEDTPEFKSLIIKNIYALRSKYGILTLSPAFTPDTPGVGKIATIPKGTAENECVYIHAAMFSILALFRLGQAETAWEEFYKVLPISNKQITKTPFVMSNSYLDNPEIGYFGQSPIDWYTGSGTVCIKNIIRGLIGIIPNLYGIVLQTAKKLPCKQLTMDCMIKGRKIHFEYANAEVGKRKIYFNQKELITKYDALTETEKAFIPEDMLANCNFIKIVD